jgi:hypothetical protein
MEVLANIEESELEGLLHDPEFLNMNPNLPPEVRRKLIEDIRFILCLIFVLVLFKHFYSREKRAKQRIVDVPPLSKTKLQEISDPLDYLYKYCIIQSVYLFHFFSSYENFFRCIVLIGWLIMNVYF